MKAPAMLARILPLVCGLGLSAVHADPATPSLEDTLVNRNTTLNLIDALVAKGVLDRATADTLIAEARAKAVKDARAELAARDAARSEPGVKADGVHVYYIPKAVKDELRREVSQSLGRDVVAAVKQDARKEAWGVPAALPAWVERFSLTADYRLRLELDRFGDDNQPFSYLDWPRINALGGLTAAGIEAFDNTTVDRERVRNRLRLGLAGTVTDALGINLRLVTSNDRSPISIDQTLGQDGEQFEVVLDRVNAQYDFRRGGFDWFTLWGGRHVSPWFATETLFDIDLSFPGVSGTFRAPLGTRARSSLIAGSPNANWGFTPAGSWFLTLGGYSLGEVEFSTRDKWLLGAQTGFDLGFGRTSRVKLGIGYYNYQHVTGRLNELGRRDFDFTAPAFFTKGNTLMRVSNDIGETAANPRLVGLAADFDIVDLTAAVDVAHFDPVHVILTGSFSRNIGYDRSDVLARTGLDLDRRTSAAEVHLDVGVPRIQARHDWNIEFAYKYVERDAVLDAFTESTFHLAGTDARGWIVGASYGLARNTWLMAQWLSSDAIDGPPFGSDVFIIDFNTGI